MILHRVEEVHKEQLVLRDKIEESNKESNKYCDVQVKALDERVKERATVELQSVKASISAQDALIATLRGDNKVLVDRIDKLTNWAEGIKARWGLIGGALSLGGGGVVVLAAKALGIGS